MLYIKDLLKNKLTATQWESLAENIGITQTRCTQMLKNPETMSAEEITALVKFLNNGITAENLINDYHCGIEKLSYKEAQMLIHPADAVH